MSNEKPRVLILGGTGFIARHLVKYIIKNDLASKILIADKKLPQTAYLSKELEEYYKNPIVEHKQANLSNPASVKSVFEHGGGKYDYVINLAAETRYGQEESMYEKMVYNLSVNCAKEAERRGECKKYIEFSTAQVYKGGKNPSKETDNLEPWTLLAKYKAKAEEEIKKMDKLPWIIVRPAIVYGPGDMNGFMPRMICAATYTISKKKMKILWTADLRINCVHVHDVVRATWHLLENGKKGDIYNLSDKSDMNQGKFNKFLEEIFNIKTTFLGSMLSNVAKLKMKDATEYANEIHMNPWSDLCRDHNISFTPLSPYIDKELLYYTPLYVDGTAIEKTGFKYEIPEVTKDLLVESIKYYEDLNLFPKVRA